MSRWRYGPSTNWEPRAWVASKAIKSLGLQIEATNPQGHATDGTVASKAHDQVSPTSDHRPTPYVGPGIVRAMDIGVFPGDPLAENLRLGMDKRVKYVIFGGRYFNGQQGSDPWQWKNYDGPNPHDTHVHISVLDNADGNANPWNLGGGDDMPLTPEDLKAIADAVWFRLITNPVTGQQRGAQALLADAVSYGFQAANKPAPPTTDQIADEIADRLDS